MQIGDGSSGPRIQSVSLSAGTSIFSGNVASEGNLGGTPWTVYYALEANTPVSLAASSPATLLAQVTFDTTGIGSGGPWPVSLKDIQIQGTPFSSEYVLGAGGPHTIDAVINSSITVVPEPRQMAGVAGLLLGLFALGRHVFRHKKRARVRRRSNS